MSRDLKSASSDLIVLKFVREKRAQRIYSRSEVRQREFHKYNLAYTMLPTYATVR